MFQIAFGLTRDTQHAIWYQDIIRSLFAVFDRVVYTLIKYVYALFFNIASTEVISSETVKAFYGRVQLILGVIMIFKLSISLLQVIIEPELMSDQKKGFGKIVSRIIVMLMMFVAIMPLSIPKEDAPKNSYNDFLNKNGLLFGTMYSLQYRILENNTIARLILGGNDGNELTGANKKQKEKEKEQINTGDQLGGYILKGFIRPNKKVCPEEDIDLGDTDIYEQYENAGAEYLIDHITGTRCYDNDHTITHPFVGEDGAYALTYFPVVTTICGLLILICLLGFCIDIAVRAVKLAVLRLIAPIPIISYIDPKSSENGAFANWVKMLITTYIDIFVRLGIIYFVIFLVQSICENGLSVGISNGVLGAFATIFIIIGLFFFARQAPKFIRDALGLKGAMQNLGLSSMLAGAGAFFSGGNMGDVLDASRNASNNQIDAYRQGKAAPPLLSNFTSGQDLMAQNLTGDPRMTHAQMRRGRNYLAREGITDDFAENKKGEIYKLKDEAEMLKNINDKINRGGFDSLTDNEKNWFEQQYKDRHGIDGPLAGAEYEQMKESAMDLYLNKQTEAGKAEAEYNMIQQEQKTHGAAPSYREKYQSTRSNARFSDIGNGTIRTGNFRETARNIISMPGNSIRGVGDARRERTAENRRYDHVQSDANNNVINSRRP